MEINKIDASLSELRKAVTVTLVFKQKKNVDEIKDSKHTTIEMYTDGLKGNQ